MEVCNGFYSKMTRDYIAFITVKVVKGIRK